MSFETVFQSKIVIDNSLEIQRSDEILTKEALNFISVLLFYTIIIFLFIHTHDSGKCFFL